MITKFQLMKAINDYAQAKVDSSWKGNTDLDSAHQIELDMKDARKKLYDMLKELFPKNN